MQQFFKERSGATLHSATFQGNNSNSLVASAITWKWSKDNSYFLRIKIVNFGTNLVSLMISLHGLESNSVDSFQSTKTVLTSNNLMDENFFALPNKVTLFTRGKAPITQQMLGETNQDFVEFSSKFSFLSNGDFQRLVRISLWYVMV